MAKEKPIYIIEIFKSGKVKRTVYGEASYIYILGILEVIKNQICKSNIKRK